MTQNVVTNAGPLMVFAKLNVLHLLKDVCGKVRFPRSVWEECVAAGIRRGYSDAYTPFFQRSCRAAASFYENEG